jgi:hypothetical protein
MFPELRERLNRLLPEPDSCSFGAGNPRPPCGDVGVKLLAISFSTEALDHGPRDTHLADKLPDYSRAGLKNTSA